MTEMTPHDEALADLLGGELNDAQRAAAEASLDPAAAAELADLRRTLEALRGLDDAPAALPARRGQRWLAALRFAAVVLLAFGVGWVARGASVPPPPPVVSGPVVAETPGAEQDAWARRVAERYVNSDVSTSLARSLLAIARAKEE